MGKQFLTIKEAARVLNVNEALVYRLTKEGVIGAYRLGSRIRISKDELRALLNQKKLTPLYRVPEASGVLKISRVTLYNLIKKNKIEALRLGKVIRLASIFGFNLNQQFLSIQELSRLLRVNPRTARRLILANKIKSIKLGSQYRIPESIFLNLTKQCELKPLLSAQEAAKILGKSRLTIINYIKNGEAAAIKVGRVYRLSEETVENYQKRIKGACTINQLAEILRVSPALIRRLAKKKDIKTLKLGGQHRLGQEEFGQFLTSIKLAGSIKKHRKIIK